MAALGFPAGDSFSAESAAGAAWGDKAPLIAVLVLPAAAVVVAARRLAGALEVPLSMPDAVVCGLSVALLSAACRAVVERSSAPGSAPFVGALRWVPTVAAFALCAATSLPGTSLGALAGLWGVVALGELVPAFRIRMRRTSGERLPSPAAGSALRRVHQQLTRFSDAAGRDVVEGTVVARFAAGQRIASVHLAFCPPFAETPEIACGAAGDVGAEVKAVQALAYAARFDVKLAAPSALAVDVPVSFSARSTS